MRSYSGLLLSFVVAAVACTRAASPAPFTPGASPPASTDPVDDGSSTPAGGRTADQVCPDMNDVGTTTANACTEMGCGNGFHLAVLPNDAWPHGKYRYLLDVDGRSVTCEGTLPLQSCETRSITCSDPAFMVTESGCALDPSAHAFGGLEIHGFPSRVHLRVEHDGKVVADEDLGASYRRVQPNGPGCGPVCCQAGDEVTLKF